MPERRVTVDLTGFSAYQREARRLFDSGGPGAVAMRQWGMRLRAFWQERFFKESRGGGSWSELAPSTILRKSAVGSRTPNTILRRYDTLVHSLNAVFSGMPGQYEARIPGGREIGIGGSGTYPSGVTVGQVAEWHHEGAGSLPERPIIVMPTAEVIDEMRNDLARALERLRGGT